MDYGFVKVAAAVPGVRVADVGYNVEAHMALMDKAEASGAELTVFPELGITGYTCQDLFHSETLLEAAEVGLDRLVGATTESRGIFVVGLPLRVGSQLFNCAVAIQGGNILAVVPKTYLPNYGEFYEKRWFASSQDIEETEIELCGTRLSFGPEAKVVRSASGYSFGMEICEDVWAPVPPSCNLALAGADIVVNLSASDELIGKHAYLRQLLAQQSARTVCAYVYAGCGYGESTQDVVYGGNAFVYENGRLLASAERFSLEAQMATAQVDVERLRAERRANTTFVNAQHGAQAVEMACASTNSRAAFKLERGFDPLPFIPKAADMAASCEEILSIQTMGLARRISHTRSRHVVVGISGGLDSTLALLVAVRAFDKLGLGRRGIIGVTMPGFGTTDRTHDNAVSLMRSLGVTDVEIGISKSVTQHFEDIGQDMAVHDVTYENGQARERTQILMDYANKVGGLVVGTGDLSELALGWATYNGDHMSMYGVNAGVPKTLIRHLVRYVAQTGVDEQSRLTLEDIIDTPISPELIPADENGNIKQKTEDLVGPYELHDFFLYYYLRFGFSPRKIFKLAQRAFDGTHPEASAYGDQTIAKWLRTFFRRFFAQQFKRSCLPDGPKVGSVSLSPRGDWRMPSDAASTLWLAECDEIGLDS